MSKVFNVTLVYENPNGRKVRFVGAVPSTPGVDIFQTVRALAPKATRRGRVVRVLRAVAVAA